MLDLYISNLTNHIFELLLIFSFFNPLTMADEETLIDYSDEENETVDNDKAKESKKYDISQRFKPETL